MSGTKEGAKKALQKIKEKYGEDFFVNMGKKGGTAPHKYPQGFATMTKEQHKTASAKGGRNRLGWRKYGR